MKSLLSILKIPILFTAGTIALFPFAYAQDKEEKTIERYINQKDVPVPDFFTPHTEEVKGRLRINCYQIDGLGKVCYLRSVMGYTPGSEEIPKKIITGPHLISVDLNENENLEDNEFFLIDYTNSQKTNPLLKKPKAEESPKEPLEKPPLQYSGGKEA